MAQIECLDIIGKSDKWLTMNKAEQKLRSTSRHQVLCTTKNQGNKTNQTKVLLCEKFFL